MGASYWARWISHQPASELRNLLLPLVMAEGYDLLSWQNDAQMFDRGGVMQKIAWSLNNGGRWNDSPTVLNVSYSRCPEGTCVVFRWTLSVKPLPDTLEKQHSFEEWIRGQMDRMIAGLCRQMHDWPLDEAPGSIDLPSESLEHAEHLDLTDDGISMSSLSGKNAAAATMLTHKPEVHYTMARFEDAPDCGRCHRPTLPIAGTANRYYCLNCRRHVTHQPVA